MKKKGPPKFKKGDRVRIAEIVSRVTADGSYEPGPHTGTIESGPKSSLGESYTVPFDGGYILNGRDVPQSMNERYMEPLEEGNAKGAGK
jgi:hypothetical protein